MGWFGKIILGIIVLGALAILADVITWIYEVSWIIPILILFVILFFVWKKSVWRKKSKIKRMVKSALVDGKITDKEKQTIVKMAKNPEWMQMKQKFIWKKCCIKYKRRKLKSKTLKRNNMALKFTEKLKNIEIQRFQYKAY